MIKEYKTQCLKARRSKRFRSRKAIFASLRKFIALSCVAGVVMISNLPLLDAYEAHVINVTAEVYKLDDPVFDPISMGFCIMEEGVDITSTDPDNGPVIVHYEVGTGTLDPDLVLDPDCDSSAGTGDPSAAPSASQHSRPSSRTGCTCWPWAGDPVIHRPPICSITPHPIPPHVGGGECLR